MELLPEHSTLSLWLSQYGSFALFFLLALGIIALPVPEETLMILAGTLIKKGILFTVPTIMAAFLGSVCGITVSYTLGRTAGHYVIYNYGKWIGLTNERLANVHKWFVKFGKWTLLIGYFIPGLRHFTGFSAGITALDFKSFAFFSYLGAFLWVSTFLSIGYFMGNYWHALWDSFEMTDQTVAITIIIGIVLASLFLFWKTKRSTPP